MNAVLKLGGAAAMLLLLLGTFSGNLALATTSDASTPSPQVAPCQTAATNTYNALDQPAAINNAMNAQDYVQGVTGYQNVVYSSIFQIDKTIAPYPACTEEVLSYNVVFTLHNSTGGWAGNLVITESQNMTVIGSSLQAQPVLANNIYPDWAGYEVPANPGATQAVYAADSYFTQPTAVYPTTPGGCGNAGVCNLVTWVGLENQMGGAGYLNQDGTTVYCTVSGTTCSNQYFAWYEILPAIWTVCKPSTGGAVSISGGDTIYASVTNEAALGLSNSKYDFYIQRLNSAKSN